MFSPSHNVLEYIPAIFRPNPTSDSVGRAWIEKLRKNSQQQKKTLLVALLLAWFCNIKKKEGLSLPEIDLKHIYIFF